MSRKFCGGSRKERTPLTQTFPPCPCEKCKLRRACGLMDREQRKCTRKDGGGGTSKRDFNAFLGEFCSIVAFFMITTAMFWVTVSQHFFVAAVQLRRSKKNVKMVAMVLAALLLLSIVFKVLRHTVEVKCRARSQSRAKENAQKRKEAIACTGLSKGGGDGGGGWSRRWLPRRSSKDNVAIANIDPKARQVFKQSKLYAIPAEMKQPPGLIVYLREMFLRHSPLH